MRMAHVWLPPAAIAVAVVRPLTVESACVQSETMPVLKKVHGATPLEGVGLGTV